MIANILDQYFPDPKPPLYHKDHYTLLVAVLLSAQATDKKVNEIVPTLFAKADNPKDMVKLSFEEVKGIISPIGLGNTKARAILELSAILLEKHNGEVPSSLEELEKLPSVGHKTASVVMAQAFDSKDVFPVDTHIARLSNRWGISKSQNPLVVEQDLKRYFEGSNWAKLHLQMIFFARKFCPARGHILESCPVCRKLDLN